MVSVMLFTNTYPCKRSVRLGTFVRGNYCPGQFHVNEQPSEASILIYYMESRSNRTNTAEVFFLLILVFARNVTGLRGPIQNRGKNLVLSI
jgi:hypothetical protein